MSDNFSILHTLNEISDLLFVTNVLFGLDTVTVDGALRNLCRPDD